MSKQKRSQRKKERRVESLLSFFMSMPLPERDVFAAACGTTVGNIKQLAYGHGMASAQMAVRIEAKSNGAVSRHDLRPDLFYVPTMTVANSEKNVQVA